MGKLILGKINLSKIDKKRLFTSEKGEIWLDVSIWENDTPDKYGNDFSIQQSTKKGEEKIYLGNGKYYAGKVEPKQDMPF